MLPVIVCIDDETHNNEALERLLRKKYTVFSTVSPNEGLELIQKHQPVVIISDQRMPQMTGVELLEKSIPISPNSIRLLLTGYTDIESVIAAINDGQIYRYLTKPWEPQDLIITIDKAYETYLLRQELKKQNEQLKSLDKLKTDFMILVTHELRTPLTAITSFTDLLKEEIKSEDTQLYFNHIQKNTARLHKLIEDILFITKIKTNTTKPSTLLSSVSIAQELQKIIKNRTSPAPIPIDLIGNEEICTIDKDYFLQSCDRLIENIHRHAKPNTRASIHVSRDKNILIVEFKNSMSKSAQLKPQEFFALFARNENIMNHTKGTGLGLSIIYAMITHIHGTVDLKTENDIFHITLRIPTAPL